MLSEKPFQVAIVISLIVHTTAFFRLPQINLFLSRRPVNHMELTYVRQTDSQPSLKLYNQSFSKNSSRSTSSKSVAPPPYIKNEQFFKDVKKISIKKPELQRPAIIAVKKKITLPSITNEASANLVYLNYYQIIREKIKRSAYQNYTRLVSGEVYLSFVILNNGQLTDLRIDNEKSTIYTYLKDITKKSINEAAPFPSFPADLDYPELSFNVIISFEIE